MANLGETPRPAPMWGMVLRIGVTGLAGRIGQLLAKEIPRSGAAFAGGIGRGGDVSALAAGCDAIIDFTNAATVQMHAHAFAEAGVRWVLGTSGLTADDDAAVAAAAKKIAVCYAANFAPAAALLMALAERMAAVLPAENFDAEITESHHRQKVDAPSGTAWALARAVAAGRGVTLDADTTHNGARRAGSVGLSSVRGGQIVGEHTLLFAGTDEHLSLTHRAFDRRSFATGAIRAAHWLREKPPGLYGMADVLGL